MNEEIMAFVAVNYGTQSLIYKYASSIKALIPNAIIVVVDNYFSEIERAEVTALCKNLDVTLVKNKNNGYGNGLEVGVSYLKSNNISVSLLVLSNIDIIFSRFDYKRVDYSCGFIPKLERGGDASENVFMTHFQRRFLFVHRIPFFRKNKYIFLSKIILFKILKIIPSDIWAIHGSCFIFYYKDEAIQQPIFNSKTFLYSEELEVASYMEANCMPLLSSNIHFEHVGGVSTNRLFPSLSKKIDIFVDSFDNWYKRWR